MHQPAVSSSKSGPPEKWQQILSDSISEPKELTRLLELDGRGSKIGYAAAAQFPLKVPRTLIPRMEKGNWRDPLLLQVWPALAEETGANGFTTDPLAERDCNPLPGLLHKYQGRVLLTAAPHCAVHCRYCFRRHFDYAGNTPGRRDWEAALTYIREKPDIEEVILSGGDPLALGDGQLRWLLRQLDALPALTTLRIHTRLPVVIPDRVTPALLSLLRGTRLQSVVVMHCNHANEVDGEVAAAFARLATTGALLLNQSVILKGVNDDPEVLAALSKRLFAHRVLPYYLHLPDPVAGTSHFAVSAGEARQVVAAMRARLPGYLVPRLVQEQAGASAKISLA